MWDENSQTNYSKFTLWIELVEAFMSFKDNGIVDNAVYVL